MFGPKWNFRKLDEELLQESMTWSCAVGPSPEETEYQEPEIWVDRVLREACDASAPRIYAKRSRKQVHWWNPEIETQRGLTIRASAVQQGQSLER